jgi:metallo-beta-lactamase family protein
MFITFYGAVREVTGSMHMVTSENDRILLDCGLYQGRRRETNEKNKILPFDPAIITNLVLSHGHIDHSGRIPLLTRHHFQGRIICTDATADACEYLLLDSASIQESDARYLNYKTVRAFLHKLEASKRTHKISNRKIKQIRKRLKTDHQQLNMDTIEDLISKHQLERVEPLYSIEDARHALTFFEGYPYRYPIKIGHDMTCKLYDAGHILGSAITIITARENGNTFRIGFTGDIGRFDRPILKNPTLQFDEEDRHLDFLIMESTYGNRRHEAAENAKTLLKEIIVKTVNRGGTLLIPAFAYGRTQELLYVLHQLYNEGQIPKVPVYVDSPLARNLTRVFGEHPEVYDRQTHEDFLEQEMNPFSFKRMHFVESVEESMELMREEKPHIVIAAAGMCEAGRILHHLRYKIHNQRNTILIVGYMAQNTLGRRILEEGRAYQKGGRKGPAPVLKFLNKHYPLKAEVIKLNGFSAHADQDELLRFVQQSNLTIQKIAVVHGEEDQSLSFARKLNREGFSAFVPHFGETCRIG